MTVPQQPGSGVAFHDGSAVWFPIVEVAAAITVDGTNKKRVKTWRKGTVQAS